MATETDTSATDWTVETLKQFFSTTLNDFRHSVDVQRKIDKDHIDSIRAADDLRYQQRFDASEKALLAASLAAKEAVQAALAAAKEAVTQAAIAAEKNGAAALAASEKAIAKAEIAQAAHNVMQNEWRATINDLTQTVAANARHEMESAVTALNSNTALAIAGLSDKITTNAARLDKQEGEKEGYGHVFAIIIAIVGLVVGLGGVGVAMFHSSLPVTIGGQSSVEQNQIVNDKLDALTRQLEFQKSQKQP